MRIVSKGLLAHHFHGSYWATVALEFDNDSDAKEALTVLDKGWETGSKHTNILICSFESETLELFKSRFSLKALPCLRKECAGKVHEIDGVEHSIDTGNAFELVLEVENKNQLKLF